ncbi:MAG: hypothetical protein B6D55_00035 [Candidatus Omnitrophica bacterium 4484_70.2]|nr:MAG: hypothetical protein B6D55_00035 [Candidatus Omnitrophica bacterium 4484_70.2]
MYRLFFLFLFLFGCQKIYKDSFVFCGTLVRIISPYKNAAKICKEEFRRLEKIFNLYDPNSELAQLNSTYNIPFSVSSELMECIKEAEKIYELTGGFFDISKARLYEFWKRIIKEKRKIEDFSALEEMVERFKRDSFSDILIDENHKKITLRRKGLKLDLGGIAKGYIIDKVVERLKKEKIDSALIDAGGDIFCLGKYKNRKWRIGIRDPQDKNKIIFVISLSNQAVATSGGYEQYFEFKRKKYSHLINPLTGFPQDNKILSVTVVAEKAALADSLATAFSVMGYEKIKDFIHKHRELKIEVFLVLMEKGKEKLYHF